MKNEKKKYKKKKKSCSQFLWDQDTKKNVPRHKWERAANLRAGVPGRTNGCILVNFNPI